MKLSVIGCGNMATSIIGGAIEKGFLKPAQVNLFDIDNEKAKKLAQKYSCGFCVNYDEVLTGADAILIAVKPGDIEYLLQQVEGKIFDKLVISICAGISIGYILGVLNKECQVARVMPNTPALVGKGASGISFNAYVTEENREFVISLFESVGIAIELPEKLIDTVTGLAGSGPAYVFMAIEAMADAGVLEGLPREIALKFAAQTFAGAAELVISKQEHPASLKDKVCSPGGTTIEGVYSLEQTGFRASIIKAVRSAIEKARKL